VPKLTRHLYAPRSTDEFVGELLYARDGQTETDYDLYRDLETRALFVIGSVSHRVGEGLNNSHVRYTVGEFLALDPAHRQRVEEALAARGPAGPS
jgi:hypothetical protein